MLSVDNLTVKYGQLTALRNVALEMAEGETLFVAGPNGAGNSTLLKAIAGAITLRGTATAGRAPEDIARMGFSMVPKGRHIFNGLIRRLVRRIHGRDRARRQGSAEPTSGASLTLPPGRVPAPRSTPLRPAARKEGAPTRPHLLAVRART